MAKTATIRKSRESRPKITLTLVGRIRRIVKIRGEGRKKREELRRSRMSIEQRERFVAREMYRKILAEIKEAAEKGGTSLEFFAGRCSSSGFVGIYFRNELEKLFEDNGFRYEMIRYHAEGIFKKQKEADFVFFEVAW